MSSSDTSDTSSASESTDIPTPKKEMKNITLMETDDVMKHFTDKLINKMSINDRVNLVKLADAQLSNSKFSKRTSTAKSVLSYINFEEMLKTYKFQSAEVEPRAFKPFELRAIYEEIRTSTRAYRTYEEMFPDMLFEATKISIKKPSNAFSIYYTENSEKFKAQFKHLSMTERMSAAAKAYREMDNESRKNYSERFNKAMANYSRALKKLQEDLDPTNINEEYKQQQKILYSNKTNAEIEQTSTSSSSRRRKTNNFHPNLPQTPFIHYCKQVLENKMTNEIKESNDEGTPVERYQRLPAVEKAKFINISMDELKEYRQQVDAFLKKNAPANYMELVKPKLGKYPLNKTEFFIWRTHCLKMPIEPSKSPRDHYATKNNLNPDDAANLWDCLKIVEKTRTKKEWSEYKANYKTNYRDWYFGQNEFNKIELFLWRNQPRLAGNGQIYDEKMDLNFLNYTKSTASSNISKIEEPTTPKSKSKNSITDKLVDSISKSLTPNVSSSKKDSSSESESGTDSSNDSSSSDSDSSEESVKGNAISMLKKQMNGKKEKKPDLTIEFSSDDEDTPPPKKKHKHSKKVSV